VKQSDLVRRFEVLSAALDARNDRRERIIKVSRDITRASKKTISLLQRATNKSARAELLRQGRHELRTIHKLIETVQKDLPDPADYFIHSGAYSPGVQEFVEACTFWHFISVGSLVSKAALEDEIQTSNSGLRFPISNADYLLGVCDLTGELMRFATNCISTGDRKETDVVLLFLRQLHAQFQAMESSALSWDFHKKLDVMLDSLKKVETVCYKVEIRCQEYPESLFANLLLTRPPPDSFGAGTGAEDDIDEGRGRADVGDG